MASPSLVDARIMALRVPPARPNSVWLTSLGSERSPTLMAITTSAPIPRATSAGTLFMAPPSTRIFPSASTGGKMSGSDIVARIAEAREPRSSTTCDADSRSTATARNGVGSSSKVAMP